MKLNKIYIFILISFVFLGIVLSTSNIYAGGGPEFYCKEMAQKQGWLIDDTKSFEELSMNACISRDPSFNEKEEILGFCKSEPKGGERDACLDKCKKYYSDIPFRECSKNEVVSTKSSAIVKGIFNRQLTLIETVGVSLAVVLIFYLTTSLIKKIKASKKQDIHN